MARQMRGIVLALSLATCAGLQLGAFAPASRRVPVARMQLGEKMETAEAAEASTELGGRVVPTLPGPASDALKTKLIEGSPQLGIVFRRAEFWANTTTTLLEVINVLGRFEACAEFRVRTEFSEVDNPREENEAQAETFRRHEMALRMGCAERVSLYQNVPKLPFTNAALAASVGLRVEDFENLAVSKTACNVVYDALAESRSGLIPYDTLDARRASMLGDDGSFNELAFRSGLYKSRALIIAAWFLFGKGNFVWVLLAVKFLHDWKPDVIPSPVDMGLFKIGTFI